VARPAAAVVVAGLGAVSAAVVIAGGGAASPAIVVADRGRPPTTVAVAWFSLAVPAVVRAAGAIIGSPLLAMVVSAFDDTSFDDPWLGVVIASLRRDDACGRQGVALII